MKAPSIQQSVDNSAILYHVLQLVWSALLLCISNVPGSNLGTDIRCAERFFMVLSSPSIIVP
jgi:hypothetical protein